MSRLAASSSKSRQVSGQQATKLSRLPSVLRAWLDFYWLIGHFSSANHMRLVANEAKDLDTAAICDRPQAWRQVSGGAGGAQATRCTSYSIHTHKPSRVGSQMIYRRLVTRCWSVSNYARRRFLWPESKLVFLPVLGCKSGLRIVGLHDDESSSS